MAGPSAVFNEILPDVEAYAAALQYAQSLAQQTKQTFDDWETWHDAVFGPQPAPFGPHHRDFWRHIWSIQRGIRPLPFAAFWSRGAAKSTSAERAVICVGSRKQRNYALYVSGTQELADKHVESIGAILESERLAEIYPEFGSRMVGKYGASKGWRRNRLRTANGFTIDALGLDVAARGIRVEDQRPDLIILDDIDEETDSNDQVEKKLKILTTKVLPAGSVDAAVIFVQNLIHAGSVASRLVNGTADMLTDRIISGPFPALDNFEYSTEIQDDGRSIYRISGDPVWEGQSLETCQFYVNTFGLRSFLAECQHQVEEPEGGMFSHINFIHLPAEEVPELVTAEVWVDPAVSATDKSDSHGISAGGVDIAGKLYITHSWEGISTPGASLRRAIEIALSIGASHVGVETDQGGDLWEETYNLIIEREFSGPGIFAPKFKFAKAGSSQMSKAHRVATMVPAYERGEIVHVLNGTGHQVVRERALRRFPAAKPFDLVDSGWHLWNSLTGGAKPAAFGVAVNSSRTTIVGNVVPFPEKPVVVAGRMHR